MRSLRAIAAGLAAGVLVAALIAFWGRVSGDFWPPDRSFIGPNLVASVIQWAVVVVVATLLYPPLRAWVHHEIDRFHQAAADRHVEVLEVLHRHHQEHMDALDPTTPGGVADIIAAVTGDTTYKGSQK